METVNLRDDSDQYQNPCNADGTGSETEIDVDPSNMCKGTTSGGCDCSQAFRRPGNGQRSVVQISTTSGSQEIPLVRRTPVHRGRIIRGRAHTPPPFRSSSVRYACWPATHTGTLSGVRSSSPVGEPGIPQPQRLRLAKD